MGQDVGVSPITATIFNPSGRQELPLAPAVARVVEACDTILRQHGMEMVLICRHCADRGLPLWPAYEGEPTAQVQGANNRYGTDWRLQCRHATRRLRLDTA